MYQDFGVTNCLHCQGKDSTTEMEDEGSTKTFLSFNQTTRLYVSNHINLHAPAQISHFTIKDHRGPRNGRKILQ
jgi:hypothetical protein